MKNHYQLPPRMIQGLLSIMLCLLPSHPLFSSPPVETPSFKNDVIPVFTRSGCNAGDCHGAARGKDGFMLSLFGYDVEGDYYRLLEEHFNRRINLANPDKSLLLEKATANVPHSGKDLFDFESEEYDIIYRWIAAGAPRDPEGTPDVTGIRMEPSVIEFEKPGGTARPRVVATFSDGTERDVTRWSLYLSSNDGVASIDEMGQVTANRSGGAHVFARYSRFTEGSEVFVLPESEDFSWSPPPASNYIDEHVYAKLKKLRIHPSPLSSDEDFLRRVTIDITGQLPTVGEYEAFMNSTAPDRRARVIDDLLERDDFGKIWAAKWGEWLRINGDTNPGTGQAMKAAWTFFHWLQEELVEGTPLDQLFSTMLTGTGSNLRNPPSNFYTMVPATNVIDPGVLGKDVATLTLGIRTDCAECHNHPFDRWTMDDYYSWTSFFTGIERKRGREPREMFVSVNVEAEPAPHLLDGRPMPHRFLGGEAPDVTDRDPRQILAEWMTQPGNRLFRRNMANRIWSHFFGRGIVEPIDDVRISNPPSNEPLLEELGRRLGEEHGYRMKDLVRDICNSTTYQLSSSTHPGNRADEEFFSHAVLRRPRADVLFDCINQAMGYVPSIRRSTRTRAIELFEGGGSDNYNAYFYETFGQSNRGSVLDSETSCSFQLSQSLHLINGSTIENAMRKSASVIPDLLRRHPNDPGPIIEELYIRGLTRKPTREEMDIILPDYPVEGDGRQRKVYFEGVLWGILNSAEFLYNH